MPPPIAAGGNIASGCADFVASASLEGAAPPWKRELPIRIGIA
jgi:hypothetical protein